MRIIVASPPKTGNIWMKSLLAEIYGLTVLTGGPTDDARSLQEYIEKGWFTEGSVFHEHYWPTGLLYRLAGQVNAHLVTTLRHPYDVFVSLYFYVQNFPELFFEGHPLRFMLERPLDDPEIYAYLKRVEDGFGIHIKLAASWIDSPKTIHVRYEDLKQDTVGEMVRVAKRIEPVSRFKIHRAVKNNSARNMRGKSPILARHIRKGSSGDWKNHLNERHLAAINENHGEWITRLGYPLSP